MELGNYLLIFACLIFAFFLGKHSTDIYENSKTLSKAIWNFIKDMLSILEYFKLVFYSFIFFIITTLTGLGIFLLMVGFPIIFPFMERYEHFKRAKKKIAAF